jgi:hypothetical protein
MKYLVSALSLAAPVFATARLNFKPYFIEGYSHDTPRITSDKKIPGFSGLHRDHKAEYG